MSDRGRPRHPDVLTPREWDVLTLVREGLTNPEIAERLGIGRDAVKYHVSEILSKLELQNREEAAAWEPERREGAMRPVWASALAPLGVLLGQLPLIGRAALVGTATVGVAAVAVLGGVLLASELSADGDGDEGMSEPGASPTATAVRDVLLPDAPPLMLIEPRALNPGTAMVVETGCFQCDGPMTSLSRVWIDADGEPHMDMLFGSAPAEVLDAYPIETDYTPTGLTNTEAMNAAVSSDGEKMAVAYCVSGVCGLGGLGTAGADANVAIYRSLQGGTEWEQIAEFQTAVFVEVVLMDGRVVVSVPAASGGNDFFVLPGGEQVTPPAGYTRVVAIPYERFGWANDAGQVADASGKVLYEIPAPGGPHEMIAFGPVAPNPPDNSAMMFWRAATGEQYITHFTTERIAALTYLASEPYVAAEPYRLSTTFPPAHGYGANISIDASGLDLPEERVLLDTLPAMILDSMIIPITEPFADPSYPADRYHVRSVQEFRARVTGTGSCLSLRRAMDPDAEALYCLPDGALLAASTETQVIDGVEWAEVVYAEDFLFAEMQYIER